MGGKRSDASNMKPGLFRRVVSALTQRLTIMFVPHTERRVVHFHVNLLVLIFAGVLFAGILVGFMYLSSIHIASGQVIDDQRQVVESSQANLDAVLQEIRNVVRVARSFDMELAETVNALGLEVTDESAPSGLSRGDLADFFDLQVVSEEDLREIQDLQSVAGMLSQSTEPLRNVRTILQSQQNLLADIPNLWPVANGFGRVTMEFGPNIHPITGQWYLHKGIDIAGPPGTPVLASANGRVVEMGYDPDYGLYVMLRHKYGFRTRYSHLQTITVREGQDVIQGESIGTLGNTGISTGPHLDFIVMLGTDVVDPAAFLKISTDFTRAGMETR